MKNLLFFLLLGLLSGVQAFAQEKFEWKVDYEHDVFENVDTLPLYIWGEDSLQKFIETKQEDVIDKEGKKVTGIVAVEFVVTKYGAVQTPLIRKSQDDRLNRSALATIAQLNGYKPGRKNGRAVNTRIVAVLHYR